MFFLVALCFLICFWCFLGFAQKVFSCFFFLSFLGFSLQSFLGFSLKFCFLEFSRVFLDFVKFLECFLPGVRLFGRLGVGGIFG